METTHTNRQACYMEPMRKQDPLPQHPLVTCVKFDFLDRKRMPQMQTAVHVGKWKVAEPFGVLLLDFRWRQTLKLGG